MKSALIGYTGFVGSNLIKQQKFDFLFNSKNISELPKESYDLLVVAAPAAVKWYANKHPEEDLEHVSALMRAFEGVNAQTVVCMSTVDVYPQPIEVDEDSEIDLSSCQPYGKHRLMLEKFLSDRFNTRVMRLPGLFGEGLKKNIIFDFLNDNEVEKIDSRNCFQFYPLKFLSADIAKVLKSEIKLLNMAVAPIETSNVAQICLGRPFKNEVVGKPILYDFRSKHARVFGGKNGHLYSLRQIEDSLRDYVAGYTRAN